MTFRVGGVVSLNLDASSHNPRKKERNAPMGTD
jgi:hypothetical protein